MIISLVFLIAAFLMFAATAIIIHKTWQAETNPETSAGFLSIVILGMLYSAAKIGQQFMVSGLYDSFENFGEIIITMLILNQGIMLVRAFFSDPQKKDEVRPRARVLIFATVLFLQFALVGSFWSMVYFYTQSEAVMSTQTGQYLSVIASSRAAHIATLVRDTKTIASSYALGSGIRSCLQEIEDGSGACTSDSFGELLRDGIVRHPTAYLANVMDKNGVVVASTDATLLGKDWSKNDEFINHTTDGYFSTIATEQEGSVNFDKPGIVVSAPVIDNGVFLGVFSAHIRPDEFNAVMQDRTGLGDTGDIYLVSTDEQLLTPQRFSDKILINVNDANVAACATDADKYVEETLGNITIAPHDSTPISFTNTYGDLMVGAHSLVGEKVNGAQWCVSAEMSDNEIQTPLRVQLLKVTMVVLVVLIVIIAAFLDVLSFFSLLLLK